VFTTKQAVKWILKSLSSDGAITWAAAMKKNKSTLVDFQFVQLQAIDRAVLNQRSTDH